MTITSPSDRFLPDSPDENVKQRTRTQTIPRFAEVFARNRVESTPPGMGWSMLISLLVQNLAQQEHIQRHHAKEIVSLMVQHAPLASDLMVRSIAILPILTIHVTRTVGAIALAPGFPNDKAASVFPQVAFLLLSPPDSREEQEAIAKRLGKLDEEESFMQVIKTSKQPQDIFDYLEMLDSQS